MLILNDKEKFFFFSKKTIIRRNFSFFFHPTKLNYNFRKKRKYFKDSLQNKN
jgi:hypothetical protein